MRELGGNLRALLRDVLCGHLDADLLSLADELLDEAADEATVAAEPEPVITADVRPDSGEDPRAQRVVDPAEPAEWARWRGE